MSSKHERPQLVQVKALIDAKDYAAARDLLRALHSPTALRWLAKLDEIAPEDKALEIDWQRITPPSISSETLFLNIILASLTLILPTALVGASYELVRPYLDSSNAVGGGYSDTAIYIVLGILWVGMFVLVYALGRRIKRRFK